MFYSFVSWYSLAVCAACILAAQGPRLRRALVLREVYASRRVALDQIARVDRWPS